MTKSALGYDLSAGALIGGVWVIERPLGAGAMGTVVRCHHTDDPTRLRALKVLDVHAPDALQRFAREGRMMSALDHPNVVKVYGVHLQAQPPYLEMALVEGQNLQDILEQSRGVGVPRALEIAALVAGVLAHLHANAIFHRDLKPANLLVSPDGTITLVDFGIAKLEDGQAMTTPGTRFGTVAYAPPEWVDPRRIKPPLWDVYSLGVLLVELLTGQPAFPVDVDASPMMEALRLMKIKAKQDHVELVGDFPPALAELVASLTSRDPEQRCQTAREALHRVRAAARDPQVAALPQLASTLQTPSLAARASHAATVAVAPDRDETPSRWRAWLLGGGAVATLGAGAALVLVVAIVLLVWWIAA